MKAFMERYASEVKGAIHGWDRLAFRGTVRWLANVSGLASYLYSQGILLKDFSAWASGLTKRIRESSQDVAERLGISAVYLRSSSVDKDALARAIAQERGIEEGPICMFSSVEPSFSPTVVRNRQSKRLEVAMRPRKCVWIYFYFNDAQLGLGHIRLETWAPFTLKVCLNGRHWLERSLLEEGIEYVKHDNCFRALGDVERAQALAHAQLRTDWTALLGRLAQTYFPVLETLLEPLPLRYYWSADETEWASDIMFHDTAHLDRLFPMLARHALVVSDSDSVMRYLGRIAPDATVPGNFSGEVRSDRRRRHEGVCVKHRVGRNSIKMYNKAGNVLRVETTLNAPRDFKVFRHPNDDPRRPQGWVRMRKGVADLERRAQVSQASNERYLDTLAACPSDATFIEVVGEVCRPVRRKGRRVRALHPGEEGDMHLLRFLTQGQWAINGLRNRDLAAWLDPRAKDLPADQRKKLTARTSRLLTTLRAHGLIRKVPKTHRYTVTAKGSRVASLMAAICNIQATELMEKAA